MPQKLFDSPGKGNLEHTSRYRPGYGWIPGYFGPPPGIPEAMKIELDHMNDKEYLYAFLKLSQEQKDSLMASEAERRRTFSVHWPIQHVVRGNDLAKDGFYFTGMQDKVQCVFCCGVIENWEKGDVPAQAHRNYFPNCNFVQKKPCYNIPFEEIDCSQALVTEEPSNKTDSYKKPCYNVPFEEIDCSQALVTEEPSNKTDSYRSEELGINTSKPNDPKFALFKTRMETFKEYSTSSPIPPHDLASAGFYFIGSPDKVKCFCCGGELIDWAVGDHCWDEHAKWFPGCSFVREKKGTSFIIQARKKMTKDELDISQTLKYNSADLSFLENVSREARKHAIEDDQKRSSSESDSKLSKRVTDITELLTRHGDLSEEESRILVEAFTCLMCKQNEFGASLLPCGHFIICESCSRGELPINCPGCGSTVRAACRAFTC